MKFHEEISRRTGEFKIEDGTGFQVTVPLLGIEADVFVEEYIKARRRHRDMILKEDLAEIDREAEERRKAAEK